MSKNWAVVIGINGYNPLNFTPLKYAKRDAERVHDFFNSMQFEQVYLFTDDSAPIGLGNGIQVPSDPTYGNLVTFLEDRFQPGVLGVGDNCWFFFAGHGERHDGKDYLMPRDANSRGTKVISGLLVSEVREWLTRGGAGTVVMVLDACRSEGSRGGQFNPSNQQGVVTFSSCNPSEKSWEVSELEQGVFTFAFLEALQLSGERSCATVERLGNYLKTRVPQLCEDHQKFPVQNPRVRVDPLEKQHFILMPQYARQADIELMKADGFRLAFQKKLRLAEQMFLQANVAAMGRDFEIIQALTDIQIQMKEIAVTASVPSSLLLPQDALIGDRSPVASPAISSLTTPSPSPKTLPQKLPPAYWNEVLGNGVLLEMVQIPAGKFWMEQTEEGKQEMLPQFSKVTYRSLSSRELPLHQMKVASFSMGKFSVTQAQYEMVMGNNPAKKSGEEFMAPDNPVINVNWFDAREFCKKLSIQTGKMYCLPSEIQWEYACRAGTETPFYFGKTITTEQANYDGNYSYGSGPKGIYREKLTPVGNFSPNKFGLFDMHGNVWEWCQDKLNKDCADKEKDNHDEINSFQELRIIRGGSWKNDPELCRSNYRNSGISGGKFDDTGFRVVCQQ